MSEGNNVFIQEKLWVIKSKRDGKGKNKLAYMCPEGTASNIKKMKDTGRNWAGHTIYPEGPHGPGTVDRSKPTRIHGIEEIHDNVPIDNVKILEHTSRWSTSNVVWRVEDPRGFEVEIYSGNMSQIMRSATISMGLITTPCVWGREGGKNVLVPTTDDIYLAARANTEIQNSKLTPDDVKPGWKVKLKNGVEAIYIGKLYGIKQDFENKTFAPRFKAPKAKVFVYISKEAYDEGSVFTRSAFDVGQILDKKVEFTDDIEAIANHHMRKKSCDPSDIIFFSHKRSFEYVTLTFKEIPKSEMIQRATRLNGYGAVLGSDNRLYFKKMSYWISKDFNSTPDRHHDSVSLDKEITWTVGRNYDNMPAIGIINNSIPKDQEKLVFSITYDELDIRNVCGKETNNGNWYSRGSMSFKPNVDESKSRYFEVTLEADGKRAFFLK